MSLMTAAAVHYAAISRFGEDVRARMTQLLSGFSDTSRAKLPFVQNLQVANKVPSLLTRQAFRISSRLDLS